MYDGLLGEAGSCWVGTMLVPMQPKLYHIVHVDRLASIIADGGLRCDAEMTRRAGAGTSIGMSHIKERRLGLALQSHTDLHVGDCVPFNFCPRSVMLHRISTQSLDLDYRGGQEPIVHLVADMRRSVDWAEANGSRWAFTTSNAGSFYFDDYADLNDLAKVDWNAVRAYYWAEVRGEKQAEFLLEHSFPWELVAHIGVYSSTTRDLVKKAMEASSHRPSVRVERSWYY